MTARVCVLVEAGAIPGRNPLVPRLAAALHERDVELVCFDATGEPWPVPPVVPEADLYLVKGDHPAVLSLAGCLHDAGAACLNDYPATAATADKARCLAALRRRGLPVPDTLVAADPSALAAALLPGPRYIKLVHGAHGEGVSLRTADAELPAAGGPWLVQQVVPGGEEVLKVYGVGTRAAVRRMRFTPGVVDAVREPATVDPAVPRVARVVSEALRLHVWGVDMVLTGSGPAIIDVNAFPGYRSVPEAAGWLAKAVLDRLRRRPQPPRPSAQKAADSRPGPR